MLRPMMRWMVWMPLAMACVQETTLTSGGTDRDTDTTPGLRPDLPDTEPPKAVCTVTPRDPVPGEAVDFKGDQSFDPDGLSILSWRWQLVASPDGSVASLPSGTANRAGFVPDVAGTYAATLTVTNERGNPSTPCAASFDAVPEEGLYIELIPELEGDDLALMLANSEVWPPLNFCSQAGCSLDWGMSGDGDDNPELYTDDASGGPETMGILEPAAGIYTVAVTDPLKAFGQPGFVLGDHEVTVVIWIDGRVKWRGTKTFEDEGRTLPFAKITWPAKNVTGL